MAGPRLEEVKIAVKTVSCEETVQMELTSYHRNTIGMGMIPTCILGMAGPNSKE